jgi:threonine dehydrogenase-like Zn-dependent dehydrogenase
MTAAAQALWFAAPGVAELRDAEVRPPQANEITVDAVASLVSLGTELKIYRGLFPPDQEVRPRTVEGTFAFPIKYGYQVVGRVAEAGAESGFDVGDAVFVRHPHQSRFTVTVDWADPPLTFKLPEYDNPEIAVFANLLDVSLNALLDVPVRVGDVVAVFGHGAIGMFCAQLARRTAVAVVVVDPSPRRRELALDLGADFAVDPSDAPAAIEEASQGRGVDVAIEASGAPDALQQAIRSTGMEGTVLVVAYYGSKPVPLVLSPEFHLDRQRMVSSMTRAINPELRSRWDLSRRMHTSFRLLPELYHPELISHRIPFERAPEAYQLADDATDDVVGIVLDYDVDG